jgi:hypothetical protein
MAVMLSALHAGRPLPQGRFLVLISVTGLTYINYSVPENSLSGLSLNREKRNSYRILVGMPEGKRLLGET